MIDRDAVPIGHIPPRRRIDPAHPGCKSIITGDEWLASGAKEPDPAIYRADPLNKRWVLKEGV